MSLYPNVSRTERNIKLLTKSMVDFGYSVTPEFVGTVFDDVQNGKTKESIIHMFLDSQLKEANAALASK